MLYITYNIPRPTGYRNDTVITFTDIPSYFSPCEIRAELPARWRILWQIKNSTQPGWWLRSGKGRLGGVRTESIIAKVSFAPLQEIWKLR